MEKEVFVIEFVCTKLKDRFAGLPSLKYMNGKIYINKEDYAIIKYEQKYLMDYEYGGKPEKGRGHLNERTIINSSKVELFSKNKEGYYLEYSKVITKNEQQNILLNGKKEVHKGGFIAEQQYFNITTENIEPLSENLFNLDTQTSYDPAYWDKFNIILNKN